MELTRNRNEGSNTLYKYFTEKLLGLQDIEIEKIDNSFHIYCCLKRKLHKYPCCNAITCTILFPICRTLILIYLLFALKMPLKLLINIIGYGKLFRLLRLFVNKNKIKALKRNAYGYRNFKRFRNRILHMFSHQT